MTSKILYNKNPKAVLRFFKYVAPCNCDRKESTRYNVVISTVPKDEGNLITRIHVECLACGYEKILDVEALGIREENFILD